MDVGGPKRVWDIASAGGRMNFFKYVFVINQVRIIAAFALGNH